MDNSKVIEGIEAALWQARFYVMNLDVKSLLSIQVADRNRLPRLAGVYFVTDSDGQVLYVGKAVDLRARWCSHQYLDRALKTPDLQIAWLELRPIDLIIVESLMIQTFSPAWNIADQKKEGDEYLRSDPERFRGLWQTA